MKFHKFHLLPAATPPMLATMTGRWLMGLAGFLAGLVGCVLLAVIEYGAWALVLPPRGKQETAPEPEVDAAGVFAMAADGVRLAGRLSLAIDGREPGRVAVLLHGFAEPSHALQAERVEALRRAGWDVAAIDLRGYGNSDGPFASFGGREVPDVTAWLDSLQARLGTETPITPILWGRSMGAAIAVRAAAQDPRIRAVILESPMIDLVEAMAVWFRKRRFPLPRLFARVVIRRASGIAGVSLARPTALETAPRVHCPALILHGDRDALVRTDQVRRLAESFPIPAPSIEVAGAGHTDVVTLGGEALLSQVTEFLREAIGSNEQG
ncbi:MAG: alpha/beta fold hydrolase [Isosphaeraceae bacterium]